MELDLSFICFISAVIISVFITADDDTPRGLFLFPVVLFILSLALGIFGTEKLYEKAFIEHGMAEYIVDKQTGKTEFIYLEPVEFLNNLGEE